MFVLKDQSDNTEQTGGQWGGSWIRTFSFDGGLDPGSILGWVKVSCRHHGGEFRLRFLRRRKKLNVSSQSGAKRPAVNPKVQPAPGEIYKSIKKQSKSV